MERRISKEEVKRAVWDCGVDKSPGPDGFSFSFYRHFWPVIEKDVFEAVDYFFMYGEIPNGLRQIMRKISSWWNIDYSDVNSYEELQVWLVSIRIQSKLKGVLEGQEDGGWGGLGIGSIYGLNIGLLFKWIWRFLQNAPDLWIKTIKAIYGQHGGIFDGSKHRSNLSPWCGILSSINSLKLKGIDLLALCIRKLGNGASIRFWEDIWHGTLPLKSVYPRVYLLESERNSNVANRVSLLDWS
ncbi:hypothetical protein Tco_0444422 [Tanacetum coccineum]